MIDTILQFFTVHGDAIISIIVAAVVLELRIAKLTATDIDDKIADKVVGLLATFGIKVDADEADAKPTDTEVK